MFRHNLLLIYRTFQRFKTTFFINLIGLSTGLACALLIYLWVNDELSVDKFHEKDSQLFLVMTNHQEAEGITTMPWTPGLLSAALAQEMSEVAYAVSASEIIDEFTLSVEDQHMGATGQFVSKNYFNIFSYDLIQGDKNQVLADKNAIVISEGLAMKLFNATENIIGKTIEWQASIFKKQVVVTGVFKDIPPQSSDQFDFVLSFDYFQDDLIENANWGNYYAITHVILQEGTNIEQFNEKIADFTKTKEKDSNITLFLKPHSDKYLYGSYENGVQTGGRIEYVQLFSIIAIFILTRKFGKTNGRRIVWLSTTLHSSKAQERMLDLGFSDEVWIFINQQPLYIDKNLYGTPMMKPPDGRCSIENTSFRVPLNEGDNQLMIGVANSFYGWGIAARLDKLTDLALEK